MILGRKGGLVDFAKGTKWYWDKITESAIDIEKKTDYDFSLWTGSFYPPVSSRKPRFVYTDNTILANLYFPGGEERVEFWKDRLEPEREFLKSSRMIFVMSRHLGTSLREQYGIAEEKIRQINAGCNAAVRPPKNKERYYNKTILFLGVEWERKGGKELFSAFKMIKKKHDKAKLIVVGCVPDIKCDGVEIVGMVSPSKVRQYLNQASIFCMPSLREPFGIAFLEALGSGLPVIACNLGAVPDFVIDGKTGYKVQPGNIEELAIRLDMLLSNPELCRKMGRNGMNLVETCYTWQRTQTIMFEEIMNNL